jgi:hypothetical protein
MRTLLIVGAAVVLMLILVMALLCRAKRIDEHYPESLGSADLREREALRAPDKRCVVKRVYAGSDLDRTQQPIAEVNKRFAAILKAPELDDLKKIQIDHLYLAPSDYDGLTSRGQ